MHAVLRRTALVATAMTAGFVGVLCTAGALFVNLRDIQDGGVLVGACAVLGVLLASLGAQRYAEWEARTIAGFLDVVARQAERLGTGDHDPAHLPVGVPEIDAVGSSIARSSRQLLGALSSEREFAADASHQLRTPLTALLMRLEEIGMTDNIDTVREEAAVAIEQAERLDATVATLLARSRRSGDVSRPVRVDHVLVLLQRHWQPRFELDHRSIAVTGARGVRVTSTETALEQILSTLVENALVHGGGTVSIDVRHSGPSVVVSVVDEGEGMTADMARRAFERHASTRSTGIGLPLARDLAERHGGRLELVSPRPAHFELFLSGAEDEAATAAPEGGSGGSAAAGGD